MKASGYLFLFYYNTNKKGTDVLSFILCTIYIAENVGGMRHNDVTLCTLKNVRNIEMNVYKL
jgi:hypothetical protein